VTKRMTQPSNKGVGDSEARTCGVGRWILRVVMAGNMRCGEGEVEGQKIQEREYERWE